MNENEENPFLSIFEENQSFLGNDTEKESRNENKEKVHQEQGWYPWLVVACSFLCICVLDGVGYSFGVLFEPLPRTEMCIAVLAAQQYVARCDYE